MTSVHAEVRASRPGAVLRGAEVGKGATALSTQMPSPMAQPPTRRDGYRLRIYSQLIHLFILDNILPVYRHKCIL